MRLHTISTWTRYLGLQNYPKVYQKVLRRHITSSKVQLDTLSPNYVLLLRYMYINLKQKIYYSKYHFMQNYYSGKHKIK